MPNKLLQIHFEFQGPFGSEMSHKLVELAESINHENGFIWKIWTENEKDHEAGGIYLFQDENTVMAYVEKHTARLKLIGVNEVFYKIFDINESLSMINHGPITHLID